MAVLITGMEGFVGQHLINAMPDSLYPIFGTALAGSPPVSKDGVFYERINLLDSNSVDDYIKEINPEYVIHLAAQSNVGVSIANPYDTLNNNFNTSLNVLEAVRRYCPDAKILLVSSSEVYGGGFPANGENFTEEDDVIPSNPYAASKRAMEIMGISYFKTYGIDVRISRSFNHTGPGQHERFVFSYIAKTLIDIKYKKQEPVISVGNIDVERDYLDVRDVTQAYVSILEKGNPCDIFNVASGHSHSLRQLISKLVEVSGLNVTIKEEQDRKRKIDKDKIAGSNKKISKIWTPKYKIEETFKDMLMYWDSKFTVGI